MLSESQEIFVHAGAHCAGAEGFQKFLGANRTQITAAGYGLVYPGRTGAARGSFDCAYPEPRHQGGDLDGFVAPLKDAIDSARQGTRGVIISEHDLAGRMSTLIGGRFYPAAGKRAEVLGRAIGRPVDRLVVTLRSYDALFLGAWRRYALERQMDPFSDYAPAMASFTGGWVEVIDALRDGLQARKVVLLPAKPEPLELFSHVAPRVRLIDPVLPTPEPAITDSAIAMIQRHYRQGGRFAQGQRDRLMAFHARQPQVRREHGFAGLQLADLRGKFVADLDTLSRMHGIEVAGGVLPAMAAE